MTRLLLAKHFSRNEKASPSVPNPSLFHGIFTAMKWYWITISIPFACCFLAGSVWADPRECEQAKAALIKFMKLDAEGETTHASREVDELIYYNGRDIPGWDSFNVISDSRILSCNSAKDNIEIKVSYNVYGKISGNATPKRLKSILAAAPKKSTESFIMVKDGDVWKIDSPSVPQPHVGMEAAKRLVNRR